MTKLLVVNPYEPSRNAIHALIQQAQLAMIEVGMKPCNPPAFLTKAERQRLARERATQKTPRKKSKRVPKRGNVVK